MNAKTLNRKHSSTMATSAVAVNKLNTELADQTFTMHVDGLEFKIGVSCLLASYKDQLAHGLLVPGYEERLLTPLSEDDIRKQVKHQFQQLRAEHHAAQEKRKEESIKQFRQLQLHQEQIFRKTHNATKGNVQDFNYGDEVNVAYQDTDATKLIKQGYENVFHLTEKSGQQAAVPTRVAKLTIWVPAEIHIRKEMFDWVMNIEESPENRTIVNLLEVDDDISAESSRLIYSSDWLQAITAKRSLAVKRSTFSFDMSDSQRPAQKIEWVWDRVLPRGGTAILGGVPKGGGKSVTAMILASQIAQGKDFLGRATVKNKVIFIAFEGDRDAIRSQLNALGGANVELLHSPGPESSREAIAAVFELAVTARPGLIIIDTLQKLLPNVELIDGVHGYGPTCAELDRLAWVAKYTGTAILFLHHNSKQDELLGSQALKGGVDTVLTLRKESHVLSSEQRIGSSLPPTKICFDQERCQLTSGETKGSIRETPSTRILNLLSDGNMTTEEVKSELQDIPRGTVAKELKKLIEEGTLFERKREANGRGRRASLYGLVR